MPCRCRPTTCRRSRTITDTDLRDARDHVALFRYLPQLAGQIPWATLGDWPTPLTEARIDGRPLWIKREGDAALVQVHDRGSRLATKKVPCDEGTGEMHSVRISFRLELDAKIDFRVVWRSGELVHDRIVIRKLK